LLKVFDAFLQRSVVGCTGLVLLGVARRVQRGLALHKAKVMAVRLDGGGIRGHANICGA